MSNDYFRFKQFTIHQQRSAMKVGTDGTLLGAWASIPHQETESQAPEPSASSSSFQVLDIGTGTGLIALMMAQRFPSALVTAIEIDSDAAGQAQENVQDSPFLDRVKVIHGDATQMGSQYDEGLFDAIVCNPPFFNHSLACPDEQRTTARHAITLTYPELMKTARHFLKEDGEFSLIIPSENKEDMEAEAALAGLFKSRECLVRTTPRKLPRRCLLAFRKHPPQDIEYTEGIIEETPGVRSAWYQELTEAFYL